MQVCGWETEREDAAPAVAWSELHGPSLRLRQPPRNRQPESRAARVGHSVGRAVERLEDSLALLHSHAGPAIRNLEFEHGSRAPYADVDRRPARRMLHGV